MRNNSAKLQGAVDFISMSTYNRKVKERCRIEKREKRT